MAFLDETGLQQVWDKVKDLKVDNYKYKFMTFKHREKFDSTKTIAQWEYLHFSFLQQNIGNSDYTNETMPAGYRLFAITNAWVSICENETQYNNYSSINSVGYISQYNYPYFESVRISAGNKTAYGVLLNFDCILEKI